jgi:predicted aspartyl protease
MPLFNFYQWTKEHGYTLTSSGALVSVVVSIPAALRAHLSEKGMPIPAAHSGYALIDTGASSTAVDQTVFDALGVAPINKIKTSTPHGEAESSVYPATIAFPDLAVTDMPMETLIGCNLKWKTVEGKEVIMLLGRDLLQYFLLVYNGKSNDVFLAY